MPAIHDTYLEVPTGCLDTLDHLHIGGAIVALAFGILFGGIVFTLSLAVGLGSRDLVSRSIENIDRSAPSRPAETMAAEAGDDSRSRLRHF